MSTGQGGKSAQSVEAIREPRRRVRRPGGDARLLAINRLFRESQGCRSRAEVAAVCLTVAEELTASRFGFLGELSDEGWLDVIALSPPAWDACRIPKPQALASLQDIPIRGLWSKAIRQETVVIVNDPANDPDSLGLPEGHPPIASLLAVPLKEAGRVFGVIALANRPGGYEEFNRSDVGEVVSAFVEVLYRQRAEGAQRALEESETRCRRLLAAVTNYTYTVRFKGGAPATTDHGWGCLAVTGYDPREFVLDPYLWINLVHPDDRQRVRLHVARLLAAEDVPPIEHRIVRKDGSIRWVRDTMVYHCDDDGQLVHYDGLIQDITERKEAEEALQESERRFRSLVETSSDWIWSIDQHGVYTYVSPKAKDLLGYEPEEMVGKTLGTFMLPDEAQRVVPLIRDAMDSGKPLLRVEHINRHKAGRHVTFETSGVPTLDAGGKLLGYQGISRDVTEGRQTWAALKQKELQLLAAQKIQGRLLPDASPQVPGFDVAGALHPAEFAAGDYYDFLTFCDGSLGLAIGDVTGHGFAPALIMASTHVLIRSLAETHSDPVEILTLANSVLIDETEDDRFVTLFLGRLDPATRTFTYASAGHSTGYILDDSGQLKARLVSTSLPLAVLPDTEFLAGEPVQLAPGDVVILLTDGIEEARSDDGKLFGTARLLDTLRAALGGTAAEVVQSLCMAARDFSADNVLIDDVTSVVIRVLPDRGRRVKG